METFLNVNTDKTIQSTDKICPFLEAFGLNLRLENVKLVFQCIVLEQ